MSITTSDFKNGMAILYNNQIYTIVDFQHVKPGKGQAFVRTKLRNLRTGTTTEYSFNAGEKLEPALVEKKKMQYLYGGSEYCFMDMETYETYELSADQIGDNKYYILEGMELSLRFFESEVLGLLLPDKVNLTITETTPAAPGASSTSTKDATLETGLRIRVPQFVKEGDKVIISTIDGTYCGRA